jgi:hypothetical protein
MEINIGGRMVNFIGIMIYLQEFSQMDLNIGIRTVDISNE